MAVYAYLRFSSDGQRDGDSIERQTRDIDAYCLTHGLTISKWLRDEGVSAFRGRNRKRGELAGFIAGVVTGEVEANSTLIVESVDRLSREEVMDALDTYSTLINAGLTIVTTMDGLTHDRSTYNKEWPRLILTIAKMAVAREESEKKSVRAKSVWKARRANLAEKKLVAFLPLWLNKIDEPNEERVRIIDRMFREIADNKFGSYKIASRLNDEGIEAWGHRRKSGRKPTWHNGSVLNIVRGRAVLGEFQPMMDGPDGTPVPAGPVIPDYYPEVVDPALYQRAQAVLNSRTFKGGGGRTGIGRANLFSKLAKCEDCGASLQRRGVGGKRHYLVCSAGGRKACSNRKNLPYNQFEETFLNSIVQVELPGVAADDSEARDRLAVAEHKRASLQTQIDNFIQMVANGTVSPALGAALEKAEREAAAMDGVIKTARDALVTIQSTPAPNNRMAALMELRAQMADPDADLTVVRSRLATAIASVVDGIYMDDRGVVTVIVMDGLFNYRIDRDVVIRADAPDYAPDRVFTRGETDRAAKVRRLRAA